MNNIVDKNNIPDKLKVYELPLKKNYKIYNNEKRLYEKLRKNREYYAKKDFAIWLNKEVEKGITNENIIQNMINDINNLVKNEYEIENFKAFKDNIASFIYYNSNA